jgi:hypothetical protein
MARFLGMTRGNYGHMESGRRKEVLTPDQSIEVARRLDIDMLHLVTAMGYPVQCPGFENEREIRLVMAFRRAHPETQRFLIQGLEGSTERATSSQARPRLQAAERPDTPYAGSP